MAPDSTGRLLLMPGPGRRAECSGGGGVVGPWKKTTVLKGPPRGQAQGDSLGEKRDQK